MIRAECHSDDYCIEITFDATKWFEQADDEEIKALANCDWGGGEPSDSVSRFFGESTTQELYNYLHAISETSAACGFECHVDADEALAWIETNRPGIYKYASGEE